MKRKHFFLALLFTALIQTTASAQPTTLTAGDIAFTGFNCDPMNDDFSFVLLKNINTGTVIRFTDFGWRTSTSSFNSNGANESEIVFTATSSINAGIEITILGSASPTATLSGAGSATVSFTTGAIGGAASAAIILSLSTGGDQILAYQGSFVFPTFIAGIHFNTYSIALGDGINSSDNTWDQGYPLGNNGNNSDKPTTLTAGSSAIWMGTVLGASPFFLEPENGIFNCSGILSTVAGVQAAAFNKANWTVNDLTPYTLPAGCTFLSNPPPTITLPPSASTLCAGLSASFTVNASGSSLSFQWQRSSDAGFTTPVNVNTGGLFTVNSTATTSTISISDNTTLNGTYFRCAVTNAGGTVNSSAVLLTANTTSLPTGNPSSTSTVGAGNSSFFLASSCRLIAKVVPGTVSGLVDATVWLETVQPAQFVKRHYEITPQSNAGTATATVTLYFTQQDFTDFNTVNVIKLPVDAADAANNKVNLRIEKRPGTSSNGTGLPSTYTGSPVTITPTSVTWNSTAARWEVTFPVTGFSGFFVKTTSFTLPVKIESFNANLKSNKTVLIEWTVSAEQDIDEYVIEKSVDGTVFKVEGNVKAVNNSSQYYSFSDANPGAGKNYYRIKVKEKNGVEYYTNTRLITLKTDTRYSAFPNPVKNILTIQQFAFVGNVTVRVTDLTGKLIETLQLNRAQQEIDMSSYKSGIYILKFDDGSVIKIIKQ
jgi:Secretion system C-terminal sorting domain